MFGNKKRRERERELDLAYPATAEIMCRRTPMGHIFYAQVGTIRGTENKFETHIMGYKDKDIFPDLTQGNKITQGYRFERREQVRKKAINKVIDQLAKDGFRPTNHRGEFWFSYIFER